MFRTLLALALFAFCAGGAMAQTRSPELERAKAIRVSNPDGAEQIVRSVLARQPNDYYALYHMGLIEDVRASRITTGPARVEHYRKAADWLERAKAVRTSQRIREATIFNTLGVFYLNLGDLVRAEQNFNLGLRNQAALSPASRGKLLGNIGYLQAVKGETAKASASLGKAASDYGNSAAQANLGRIDTVKELQMAPVQQRAVPAKP